MIIFYFCPWIFFLPFEYFFAFGLWLFFILPSNKNFILWIQLLLFFLMYMYKCFFLMYSIIFFFPFGCPWVGGCPSPRACWAYPRAGLDNRHKVLLWVSGLEGTRTSNDWGIHPRPDQLNYLLGLHLLSIFDLIF